MKIKIGFGTYTVEATLMNTPTGKAIFESLPIKSTVNTWGDEIYFGVPVDVNLESGAISEVEIGDLAYWPPMPAFCIFFGPTPASLGDNPAAASPVNVFGKLAATDIEQLRRIQDGESVTIEQTD